MGNVNATTTDENTALDSSDPDSNHVLEAFKHWTTEQLKESVRSDPDFARTTSRLTGQTTAHWAAALDRVEVLAFLLDNGPPGLLNAQTTGPVFRRGESPLFFAISRGSQKAAKLLLDRGANPNLCRWNGEHPVQFAAIVGQAEILQDLLSRKESLDLGPDALTKCLALACGCENVNVALVLLESGANINGCGSGPSENPLFASVMEGKLRSVQFLVENGVDLSTVQQPLKIADFSGHSEVVQFLVKKDPRLVEGLVQARSPRPGWPVLFTATILNRTDLMEVLLETGAADPNAFDDKGETALHVAARWPGISVETVDTLLRYGARSDIPSQSATTPGETPIAKSAKWGREAILSKFLANGTVSDQVLKEAQHLAQAHPTCCELISNALGGGNNVDTAVPTKHHDSCTETTRVVDAATTAPDDLDCTSTTEVSEYDTMALELIKEMQGVQEAFKTIQKVVETLPHPQWESEMVEVMQNVVGSTQEVVSSGTEDATPDARVMVESSNLNDADAKESNKLAGGGLGNLLDSSKPHDLFTDCAIRGALLESPFFRAVCNFTVEEVERMVQANRELVNFRDPVCGRTALHYAATENRTPTLRLLLWNGADIDAEDAQGQTALHEAAYQGCMSSMETLVASGANVAIRDENRLTALDIACHRGNVEAVSAMLDSRNVGKDVLNVSYYIAATGDHPSCVRLLLEEGADVDYIGSSNGMSVFQYLCSKGKTEFVRLCLDHQPDLQLRCDEKTALDFAILADHKDVVGLIEKKLGGRHTQYGGSNVKTQILNAALRDADLEVGKSGPLLAQALTETFDKLDLKEGFCSACHNTVLEEQTCFYECMSCRRQNHSRQYCPSCVFGKHQRANGICSDHILTRVGTPPVSQHQKIRGIQSTTDGRDINHWNRCDENMWLAVRSTEVDSLGVYEFLNQLSDASFVGKLSGDDEPFLSVLAAHGFTNIHETFFLQERGNITSKNAPSLQQDNIMSKLHDGCCSKDYHFPRDMKSWLMAQVTRPRTNLPKWFPLLGACLRGTAILPNAIAMFCHNKCHVQLSNVQASGMQLARSHLKRSVQREYPILTDMHLGELVVCLLSAGELARPEMPAHDHCRNATFGMDGGPTARIFVSHAWRGKVHPDKDAVDWKSLREYVYFLVDRMVLLYMYLLAMGFAPVDIAKDPFHHPNARTEFVEFLKTSGQNSFSIEKKTEDSYDVTSNALLAKILQIVVFCGRNKGFPHDASCYASIWLNTVSRIYLWIDYVCLPQSVVRDRSSEEEKWFQESLSQLGEIQNSMFTFILFDPNTKYFSRAWCSVEYINASNEHYVVGSSPVPHTDVPDLDRWTFVLVGTQQSTADDVIRALGLKITNDADTSVICRVVWPRIVEYLQTSASIGKHGSSNAMASALGVKELDSTGAKLWLVAEGPAIMVIEYLRASSSSSFRNFDEWLCWRQKFREQKPTGERAKSFLLLGDSCVNSRAHHLVPCLQALANLLDSEYEQNLKARVRVFVIFNAEESDIPDDSDIVALPTSSFGERADFVVLHPEQMAFEEVPATLLDTEACAIS